MKQKQLLLSLIAGLLLVACGGDDETTPPRTETPAYTGLETEATISTSNAESIVREMFGLGDVGGVVVIRSMLSTEEEAVEPKPEPYNILIPLALTETIERINTENTIASDAAAKTLNIVTSCEEAQGLIDYNITIDDFTGVFNGAINYRDCLVAGFTLNGSADISGDYDLVNDTFLKIDFDFRWFRGDSEAVSYVAADKISVEFIDDATTTTTLTNYVVTIDDLPVVKFEDYAITVTQDEADKSLTLSGVFYHPDHGFVTVTTDGSLSFTADNIWPYFGQLVMDGDTSSLRILLEDSARYTLWVDEDDDGEYDTVDFVDWL